MAKQGGWVQLEQSLMQLGLTMPKIAKGGFSDAVIEEKQQLNIKPGSKDREGKKRGVKFAGHQKVKAAVERHPAMVYKNHTARCLPCQNGTAKIPETRWRPKETAAPPPDPVAPRPGMAPAPPGDAEGNECYEIEGM
jgi:hypothetical protein